MGRARPATARPEGAPLAVTAIPASLIAGSIALVMANRGAPMIPLLLGIIAGTFMLGLNSAVWLLVPIVLTEFALPAYILEGPGMSLRLAVVLAATVLCTTAIFRSGLLRDSAARRVLLPAVAFVILATVANSLHSEDEYVFKYFRYQIIQLLSLVLVASIVRDRTDVKRLAWIFVICGLVSATMAIWQHFDRSGALYGAASAEHISGWKGRSLGLTDSPVALANDLTVVLLPLVGLLAVSPLRLDRPRLFLLASVLVTAGGIYFTYTRSAAAAVGVGLFVIGLLLKGHRRTVVIGIVIGIVVMFELLRGTGIIGHRYYRDSSNDTSAASHEVLWDVGLAVALDNSVLGIGHEHFESVALEYAHVVEQDAGGPSGLSAIGNERPHNDFLSVWMSWGIVAFGAYLALFVGALANLVLAARNNDRLIYGLAIGCAGALVTYGFNSAFHNYLDSSTYLWLLGGLSIVLARLPVAARVTSRARRRVPARPTFRAAMRLGMGL